MRAADASLRPDVENAAHAARADIAQLGAGQLRPSRAAAAPDHRELADFLIEGHARQQALDPRLQLFSRHVSCLDGVHPVIRL